MRTSYRQNIIKSVLADLPHGQPFDLETLEKHDVSSFLASSYARRGWLTRLGRGVYGYPNDELQLDACLLLLQSHVDGFHVGGKTALAWQGIRHNVSSREPLYLWGEQRYVLPDWFTSRFPAHYLYRGLFNFPEASLPGALPPGLTTLPDHNEALLVSTRERALLEMINEVGVSQDQEESALLFEQFSSLRPEVIGPLLAACTRVKTVRLFLHLAAQSGVVDTGALIKQYALPLGSSARWIRRLDDGSTLSLKNPTC